MSIFDVLFGDSIPWDYPYGNGPLFNEADSIQRQWAQYQACPQKRLEPGIEWKRTGPRTHRVTIRTQPEWAVDYEKLAEWQTQANPFLLNQNLGQFAP